ncbi:acyltransferase family protein [Caulobacter sp. SLTY]|uniref:acyltransferase family protein n=1 Tax=Caulobacter sp. SLTY TaxID=2683262 RepID=UPI001412D894|nr:acyltransferase [Caulobacter sp. SLTY]NBB17038.1 acyltransferase family protein [Caulobacter sp. SLTY]
MNREIVGIQYLRGLAALAVVLDHAAATVATHLGEPILGGKLYAGAVGVDLFFLISGFIITVVSLDSDWQPKVKVGAFFRKRFVRIVPVMWVAILSYGALRIVGLGGIDPVPYLRALVLSPVGLMEPLHIWTLRHEFIFYAVFALTMLGPRWLRPFLVVWCLLPIVGALGEFPEIIEKLAWPTNVEFAAGVLLGLLYLKRPAEIRLPGGAFAISVALVTGLVVAAATFGHAFHLLSSTALMALICAPILAFGVYVQGPTFEPGRRLGDASYALYLFHPHILGAGAFLIRGLPIPPLLAFAGLVVACVAGGLAAHYWLERPLLSLFKRRTTPPPSTPNP